VREGEEIEEEGAGSGLLEIGSERGGVVAEFGLQAALGSGIGREEGKVRAAGEGARGGESGSEPETGRCVVDGEEGGSGTCLRAAFHGGARSRQGREVRHHVDESGGSA
jgi:hypothetical protein